MSEWLPEKDQTVISIPHNYIPYDHQYGLWEYFQQDKPHLRGVAVWHRRAGKDLSAINLIGTKMLQRRGAYWHLFPTYKQGRRIAWDGMTSDGDRFIDTFPPELIASVNNTDMKVTLTNGSIYQIIGGDNLDFLVGANPVGLVISEWSVMNPSLWEYVEPILLANGGWALFIYTPRGRNHGFDLYEAARIDPEWYCTKFTIENTRKNNGEPIVTLEQIDKLRKQGRPEEIIQQEYYCSFDASLVGAYYAQAMKKVKEQNRIRKILYDPFVPVHTCWDLGMNDETVIWFFQEVRNELHWLELEIGSGEGLARYAALLKSKEYMGNYGNHYAPFDINVRELGTGKTRLETAYRYGINFKPIPKLSINDGIEACRQVIQVSWFDEIGCKQGIRALDEYTKEFDDKRGVYKSKPADFWGIHIVDSFRTGAVGHQNKGLVKESNKSVQAVIDYDIFDY